MDAISQIRKKNSKKHEANKPFLPDGIIINILSRVPVKKTIQCQLVCKKWKDLTSDQDFVDLHCRNHIQPMILVASPRYNYEFEIFSIDKWWESARKRLMFLKFPFYSRKLPYTSRALFSHDGLIAFRQNRHVYEENAIFIILNPSKPENVRITLSKEIWSSKIYGVFFHPVMNEYSSLWNIGSHLTQPKENHFKMLNLGPNPYFKTINCPFNHRYKWSDSNPVLINKYLYWMLEPEQINMKDPSDIMEFSILSEEFRVISCPVPLGRLLNIYGTLSYLKIYPTKITIWKMVHRATVQLWTSIEYTFSFENFVEPPYLRGWHEERTATAVVDEKLALVVGRRLHVCNLMEGTVKSYQKSVYYCHNASFLSHQMSLVSLKNCKPTIFIDKDGHVVEISSG